MSSTIKEGRTPIYDPALKIAIAREYLTSNLGYGKLAAKHKLALRTVIHFVTWYRKNYPEPTAQTTIQSTKQPASSVTNQELEEELKEANLKIAALEMLIENASKELETDIIKKSGTKQSLK